MVCLLAISASKQASELESAILRTYHVTLNDPYRGVVKWMVQHGVQTLALGCIWELINRLSGPICFVLFFLLTAGGNVNEGGTTFSVPLQQNRRPNCQMTVTFQPPTEHTASGRKRHTSTLSNSGPSPDVSSIHCAFHLIWYIVFFWVVPRRLNYICRRFGTLYLFHLHRQVV